MHGPIPYHTHPPLQVYDRAAVLLVGEAATTNFGVAAALADVSCPLVPEVERQLQEAGDRMRQRAAARAAAAAAEGADTAAGDAATGSGAAGEPAVAEPAGASPQLLAPAASAAEAPGVLSVQAGAGTATGAPNGVAHNAPPHAPGAAPAAPPAAVSGEVEPPHWAELRAAQPPQQVAQLLGQASLMAGAVSRQRQPRCKRQPAQQAPQPRPAAQAAFKRQRPGQAFFPHSSSRSAAARDRKPPDQAGSAGTAHALGEAPPHQGHALQLRLRRTASAPERASQVSTTHMGSHLGAAAIYGAPLIAQPPLEGTRSGLAAPPAGVGAPAHAPCTQEGSAEAWGWFGPPAQGLLVMAGGGRAAQEAAAAPGMQLPAGTQPSGEPTEGHQELWAVLDAFLDECVATGGPVCVQPTMQQQPLFAAPFTGQPPQQQPAQQQQHHHHQQQHQQQHHHHHQQQQKHHQQQHQQQPAQQQLRQELPMQRPALQLQQRELAVRWLMGGLPDSGAPIVCSTPRPPAPWGQPRSTSSWASVAGPVSGLAPPQQLLAAPPLHQEAQPPVLMQHIPGLPQLDAYHQQQQHDHQHQKQAAWEPWPALPPALQQQGMPPPFAGQTCIEGIVPPLREC